jgi:exosome complex RNA-binding protein Rrp42 (RNase PH superfamily)
MKKIFTIATAAALIGLVGLSCTSNKQIEQSSADKTINMQVYTTNNYSSKVYDGSTAALYISVNKTAKNKSEVVMEKTFPSMPLQYFPDAVNAFKDSILVAGVKQEEALNVSYTLTYNSNGSVVQMQGSEVITGNQKDGKLLINI